MKKILFLAVILIILLSSNFVGAETLYLKNGEVVSGKIVGKGTFYTIINVDGKNIEYKNHEIERTEKDKEYNIDIGTLDRSKFISISQSKLELIVLLLDVNGTRANMQKNVDSIFAKTPVDKREEMEKLFNIDEILEKIIPLYDKYYSENDIRQLLSFYSSDIGQKVVEVNPQLMQDVVTESIKYFQEKLTSGNLDL